MTKSLLSSLAGRGIGSFGWRVALLLALPLAASAANPVLTIVGTGNASPDVTAFVDKVEIIRASDNTVVAGGVPNFSFETFGPLSNGNYGYAPGGALWTFNTGAGIAQNGSNFGAPTAPDGTAVAFVQSYNGGNGLLQQALTLANGTYRVRFQTAQRTCCSTQNQGLNVSIDGALVGTIQPTATGSYQTFTSNTFSVGPNNALAFDGADDYVALPSTAPVPLANSNYTIEAWIKPTAMGGYGIIGWGNYGNNNQVNALRLSPTGIINYWWANDLSVTTANLSGAWHHVAATFDGTTRRIYLDGVQVGADTPSGHAVPNANNLRIGSTNGGEFFPGSIDEVRVYNTGLTAAQVQADMFSTNPAVPASQVAYFNFDQGTAGGSNTGITTLTDQSGNNSTGTLTNFALTGTTSNWVRSFPTITGLSTTLGVVGTSVTVTGTNLLDATSVKFNGTAVSPFTTPTNDFAATVTVPGGATTGPVSVSSAALSLYNGPAFTVTNTTAVTWAGLLNTDWATPSNWTPAIVPTSTIDATIPSAPTNQPVASGTQAAKNVTVAAGARLTLAPTTAPTTQLTLGAPFGPGSLTLAAGSTLTQGAASEIYITGNMTNNGATFALNATSEVGFGVTTFNHILNGTAGITFQTLTVGEQGSNDNLNIQVPVQVRRLLGVYHNSATALGAGGSLTLLSDATGTALIENGDAGSSVGGPVTVQRYIDPSVNAGLGYRHYSAPVSGSTVGDLATAGFAPVLTASYNASATPGTTTPFPTVFAYDQSRVASAVNNYTPFDKGFVVPAGTGTALAVGQGYAVNIGANQLVDFVGTPTTGTRTVSLTRNAAASTNTAAAGWQLVGNPYPAPLDFSLIAAGDRPNLDASMYVFESSSQYAGSYRSYVNGVGISSLIGSSQGFFVRVSTGQTAGSLTFRDAQRITAFATQVPVRRTTADTRPLVQLELRGATGPADALFAYAETGATPAFDAQYDAMKLPNTTGLNLASVASTSESLAIDGRPAFTASTVLPLTVGVPAAGSYTLAAAALANLPAGLDAFLTDAATGQTTNLSLTPSYAFSVSPGQAAALITGRFTLTFAARTALATAQALTAAEVTLYPNPAHDTFTVLVPAVAGATLVQGTLLNTLGQVVRRQAVPASAAGARLVVEASGLAAGVYTLRLQVGAATLAKRVVIQ